MQPSEPSNRVCGQSALRRIACLLWWTPIAACPIIVLAIQYWIPDLNRNSIGDGFRKMNVMASVSVPLGIVSWSLAFAITAYLDYRLIPSPRLRYWILALVFLAGIVLLCMYAES